MKKNFRRMEFNPVHDKELSEKIQKRLFELGYKWIAWGKNVSYTDSHYLHTDEYGNITHCHHSIPDSYESMTYEGIMMVKEYNPEVKEAKITIKKAEYTYDAYVERVIDGDTVVCLIDMGFDTHIKKHVRLLGFDAPEVRTRNLEEKKIGLHVKEYLSDMILKQKVVLQTIESDSFGRWLGNVWWKDIFINQDVEEYCTQLLRPRNQVVEGADVE